MPPSAGWGGGEWTKMRWCGVRWRVPFACSPRRDKTTSSTCTVALAAFPLDWYSYFRAFAIRVRSIAIMRGVGGGQTLKLVSLTSHKAEADES